MPDYIVNVHLYSIISRDVKPYSRFVPCCTFVCMCELFVTSEWFSLVIMNNGLNSLLFVTFCHCLCISVSVCVLLYVCVCLFLLCSVTVCNYDIIVTVNANLIDSQSQI